MTQDTARIAELFEFNLKDELYRYNNTKEKIILLDGTEWLPLSISREATDNPGGDSPNPILRISMDAESDVIIRHNILQLYPTVRVYNLNIIENTQRLIFAGRINSIEIDISRQEQVATLEVVSTFATELERTIPRFTYAPVCHVPLYSKRCGVRKILYTAARTIASISNNGLTLTFNSNLSVTAQSSPPVNYFQGGVIERKTDNVRRNIRSSTVNGASIVLAHPFRDLELGDEVEVARGCNHTLSDCKTFIPPGANVVGNRGNLRRFRGFSTINENTFRDGILYAPPKRQGG